MAKVKLRAFEIINSDINKAQSDLEDKLRSFLNASTETNGRRMILNAEDPQQEEDLISDFPKILEAPNPIFCTMLRVALGNNVQHVNSELFSKPKFTIADLKNSIVDAEAIYLNHYYFSTSNNFLVTTLKGNLTITRLQTYLNWLLEDLYEISPLVAEEAMPELSQIKDIVVKDSSIHPSPSQSTEIESTRKSFIDLGRAAWDAVKYALSDTEKLSDIELEQMVSAKLVIEFKKPKKSDSDAIKKAYSALLKPVADLENFEFITRNNKRIVKGKQILRIKEVSIETTESGMLNESQLSQEMARFIRELENERQKASN